MSLLNTGKLIAGSDGITAKINNRVIKCHYPRKMSYGENNPEVCGIREFNVHSELERAGVSVPHLYGQGKGGLGLYPRSPPVISEFVDGSHFTEYDGHVSDDVARLKVAVKGSDLPLVVRRIEDELRKAEKVGYRPFEDFLSNILIDRENNPVFIDFMRWKKEDDKGALTMRTYPFRLSGTMQSYKEDVINETDFDIASLDRMKDGEIMFTQRTESRSS